MHNKSGEPTVVLSDEVRIQDGRCGEVVWVPGLVDHVWVADGPLSRTWTFRPVPVQDGWVRVEDGEMNHNDVTPGCWSNFNR